MNKTIAIFSSLAATFALIAQSGSARDGYYYNGGEQYARASLGWESEYVFRGIQASKYVFQPGAEFGVDDFYAGIEGTLSVEDDYSHLHEVDFYGGVRHDVDDLISIDVGGILYYFPDVRDELPGQDQVTGEVLTGVGLQLAGEPWLYFYYDVRSEDFTIEGTLSHEIPLDEVWGVELNAAGGHAWVRDGKPWAPSNVNYFYTRIGADLTHAVDENQTVSVGGRYSANGLGDGVRAAHGINGANLWWGARYTAEF